LIEPSIVILPFSAPEVVMEPPCTGPLTLMAVLLLPAEIVGPFIEPMVMLPMTEPKVVMKPPFSP